LVQEHATCGDKEELEARPVAREKILVLVKGVEHGDLDQVVRLDHCSGVDKVTVEDTSHTETQDLGRKNKKPVGEKPCQSISIMEVGSIVANDQTLLVTTIKSDPTKVCFAYCSRKQLCLCYLYCVNFVFETTSTDQSSLLMPTGLVPRGSDSINS
jgi:hypothetical protein